MNRKTASSVLSALLFVYGLLGVGAFATVVLHRPNLPAVVSLADVPAEVAVR